MRRAWMLGAIVVTVSLFTLAEARADETDGLFDKGRTALVAGDYGAAIDAFEALADRGFVHPDASYDRGMAYVMRVRAHADKQGDLGRAAAGFEEALALRPGDPDAEQALDLVRAEIARRRSRRAKEVVDTRPTLDRMVVGLATERTWGLLAIASSLLFTLGLVLRKRPAGSAHVAGSVLAPTALVALLVFVPLTWGARTLRLGTRPGVVVAPEVYLADDKGSAAAGEPVPEAALLETGERRGGLIHVRHGAAEGWLPLGSVRVLASP